jgi:ATP-dependent protease ClpP protease subunit
MTPEEAMAYGLIDGIIAPRRGLAAPSVEVAVG